jgi:hypothetical protein
MKYKVVPFTASIRSTSGASEAASQLQTLIDVNTAEGWEYIRLEHVDTYVAGNPGCLGFGATPGQTISIAMAVFRQ